VRVCREFSEKVFQKLLKIFRGVNTLSASFASHPFRRLARFLLASYPIDISRQLGEYELSNYQVQKNSYGTILDVAWFLLAKINMQ